MINTYLNSLINDKNELINIYNNFGLNINQSSTFTDIAKESKNIQLAPKPFITDLSYLFSYRRQLNFNQLKNFIDINNITNLYETFSSNYKYTSFLLTNIMGIDNWNTSKVNSMYYTFGGCLKLTNLSNLSNWDTSNVTNMSGMFTAAVNLSNINGIENWNTSKVTNMSEMFDSCRYLISVGNLANWDTSNVTNISSMFSYCNNLTSVRNLANWDTSNVTNSRFMFCDCCNLTTLDLSNWNTSNIIDMDYMFARSSLEHLNAWNWDTSNITNISGMFTECNHFYSITIGTNNFVMKSPRLFYGTCIENTITNTGNQKGAICVPSHLVNEYKQKTNWVYYANAIVDMNTWSNN